MSFTPRTQLPESIAVGRHGVMYVSLFSAQAIVKVEPDGSWAYFATGLPGSPAGVRLDAFGNVYVALVDVQNNGAGSGVWRVPARGGAPVEVARVPGFPNGLAFDGAGNLFVTESYAGRVWRVTPSGQLSLWSDSPLLAAGDTGHLPCGPHPAGPLGANGIAFDPRGDVLVTNTTQATIVRITVNRDGSAGPAHVITGPDCARLFGADGLAADVYGNVYVAANASDDIVRVDEAGRDLRVLASRACGDQLSTPSDVAFGTAWPTRTDVFITNFTYLHLGETPGVVRLNVGIPGAPLP